MFPHNCGELEKLIIILRDGDKSGTNPGVKNDEYLMRIMDHLFSEDREKIRKGIKWLEDDFLRNEVKYVDVRTSIAIMIAYAYCKIGNQQQSFYYAWAAKEQFPRYPKSFWNEALAFWFLGMVYQNGENSEGAKNALKIAKELLDKHAEVAHSEGYSETLDLCHEYIHQIEQTLNKLPPRTVSQPSPPANKETESLLKKVSDKLKGFSSSPPTGPEPTPMKQNDSMVDQVRSREMNLDDETPPSKPRGQEASRASSPSSRSSPFHIIIPVDIQALVNPQWASRALDAKLYAWLREYNRRKPDQNSTDQGEAAKNPKPAKKPRPIIPSYPIYGQAAAGLSGEPNLDSAELEKADIVYDDLRINFEGKEYGVRFIENEEYNFVGWRLYGWLQVIGESMNNCLPIPIKDGNFVLFAENRDINSCVKKIVVAILPELDAQPAQLVVKRLLKLSTQPLSKYVLRSESSLERDPRIGLSYKRDIEVVKDNQLVGEVIAIASPV